LFYYGEKTSIEDVAGPIAEELGAGLALCSGQVSDTILFRVCKAAMADGRPLILFTLSDSDPAGFWDMPTAIGRKMQAMRDSLFPRLMYKVVHVGLSPEQAKELDLPSSPIKEGEQRGEDWLALYDMEQTEIDALAQLQPDKLEEIIREVAEPYYDAELAERVQTAKEEWEARAQDEIDEQVDDDALAELKDRARAALAELKEVNDALDEMRDAIEIKEPIPNLPRPDVRELAQAQAEQYDKVLVDSEMDYVKATDRLREHNELDYRREQQKARKKNGGG
jgi:hypothetical protein